MQAEVVEGRANLDRNFEQQTGQTDFRMCCRTMYAIF